MDLTTIDISHAPQLQPGDEVTLLGREGDAGLDAQQIARVAGTISYNILCEHQRAGAAGVRLIRANRFNPHKSLSRCNDIDAICGGE